MKLTKYVYLWVIQGNYGCGWEDVSAEETWKEARQCVKEYRENEPQYAHRVIKRRELREPEPQQLTPHVLGVVCQACA